MRLTLCREKKTSACLHAFQVLHPPGRKEFQEETNAGIKYLCNGVCVENSMTEGQGREAESDAFGGGIYEGGEDRWQARKGKLLTDLLSASYRHQGEVQHL